MHEPSTNSLDLSSQSVGPLSSEPTIQVTRRKRHEVINIRVSPEDADLASSQPKWWLCSSPIPRNSRVCRGDTNHREYLHRTIGDRMWGDRAGSYRVHFRDGDYRNCTRSNLFLQPVLASLQTPLPDLSCATWAPPPG